MEPALASICFATLKREGPLSTSEKPDSKSRVLVSISYVRPRHFREQRSSRVAWKQVLSSILGGFTGIAVLVGLAAAIGWTLTTLGWSPS